MFNIAVLTSGMSRGSNLMAMTDYFSAHKIPVRICFVVRTRADAPIKNVCASLGIPCHYIPYQNPEQFEEKVLYLALYHGLHLLALAGFLKKLSPVFIRNLCLPILNIHPALLPDNGGPGMYGLAVHKAVFERGQKVSGVTIHLVDASYDHGRIISQQQVNIADCRSPEEVAAKVLEIEHQIYGKTIWSYLQSIYS